VAADRAEPDLAGGLAGGFADTRLMPVGDD